MNIETIIKQLDNINLSDEEVDALMAKLYDLDPYNDIFHLGCANWPNCETEGCGGD